MTAAALLRSGAPAAAPAAARSPALVAVVGLGAFVAASHAESAVSAFAASPAIGLGLCAVALAAGVWSVRVARRPARGLLSLGAAGALALVALWVATRTAGGAAVGVLDAVTAFDELLLAWVAIGIARGRPRAERWPLAGCVAISLSFMALAMGCAPPAVPAAAGSDGAARGPAAICHLY